MNIFDNYTFQLLQELNTKQVEYLVVGGYAVNFHGYRRTTGDIDLWIKPNNGINKEKIIDCLRNLAVTENILSKLNTLDFTVPLVFVDGKEPFKIDFMTHISGVNFDEAWTEKTIEEIDGLRIPFIHFKHLIVSKISSGRAKDKIDVEELQRLKLK